MFFISWESKSQTASEFAARGRFEVREHYLGTFVSRHRRLGDLLSGTIEISFSGYDPLAGASLNNSEIGQALAFRGSVEVQWEDRPEEANYRLVVLSYESAMLGEEHGLMAIRSTAFLDLGAIDVFLGRATYTNSHGHAPQPACAW